MEWHQYFRSVRECWIVLIYDTGRGVQADQKDGTAKIDLLFSQHQASHSWSFLFVKMMMGRFGYEKNNINNHSFNNAACLWAKPY